MSKSGLVIICIFAAIGIVTCVFTLFRIVEWLCDKSDKFQLLYGQYERMSNTLEDIHKIVELQQDEIKILKEWLCDKSDKFQLLYGQYERMSNTLEDIHKIVELQQDEIKILKERIDIYEESNSED